MRNLFRFLPAFLVALTLWISACDDNKEEDHKECGCPLAGEMMSGEMAGEEVMPVAGEEEEDEMPDQVDMEMPEEMPDMEMDSDPMPPECPEGQEC